MYFEVILGDSEGEHNKKESDTENDEEIKAQSKMIRQKIQGKLILEFSFSKVRFESADQIMTKISNVSHILKQEHEKLKYIYQEAFIGTFSHEQMTPLNSIINLSSVLIDKYREESNEDIGLLSIVNQSARMMKITNQTFIECQNIE